MATATYIALIPKGLEDVATDLIAQKLDVRNFDIPQPWLNAQDNAGGSTNTMPSDAQIASQIRVSQQARKDKAGRRPPSAQGKRQRRDGQIITPDEVVSPSIMDQHKKQSLKRPLQDEQETQENDPVVGTVKIESGAEFAMGYHYRTQSTNRHLEIIRSHPGLWEGLAWWTFGLPQTPEAARAVSSTRGMGCGPLLALVTTTSSPLLSFTQTKYEALQSLRNSSISSPLYVHEFRRALVTWYHHASTVWNDSKDTERQTNLKEKMKGLRPFAYRISIVRENTKDYSYPRQELLEPIDENDSVFTLANLLVPIHKLSGRNLFLSIDDELSDVTQQDYKPIVEKKDEDVDHDLRWRVDLKQFDFEVVFAIHANGHVTVAISLRPYQLLGTKCFSSSSRLPPDVLEPHLAIGSDAKTDMVRLRPSTANLLIHMAQLQPGDIVLDPCAGMGTIPLEASFQTHIVGFGGDVYLPNSLVSSYSHQIRQFQDTTTSTCKGVGEMMQWDAALLPFRDGFVDAIISDLPFGQKCLSAIELKNFLPLMLSECARVLTPTTGRMVLLCGGGSHITVMDTIHLLKEFWQQPCRAVRPVNISGILAWILVIDRSSNPYIFDQECMDKNNENHTGSGSTFFPISNHRARVRKMTSKRRQRNADKSLSRS
eukprot:scaffold19457_cov49-Attheya_sp.AAC.2